MIISLEYFIPHIFYCTIENLSSFYKLHKNDLNSNYNFDGRHNIYLVLHSLQKIKCIFVKSIKNQSEYCKLHSLINQYFT